MAAAHTPFAKGLGALSLFLCVTCCKLPPVRVLERQLDVKRLGEEKVGELENLKMNAIHAYLATFVPWLSPSALGSSTV